MTGPYLRGESCACRTRTLRLGRRSVTPRTGSPPWAGLIVGGVSRFDSYPVHPGPCTPGAKWCATAHSRRETRSAPYHQAGAVDLRGAGRRQTDLVTCSRHCPSPHSPGGRQCSRTAARVSGGGAPRAFATVRRIRSAQGSAVPTTKPWAPAAHGNQPPRPRRKGSCPPSLIPTKRRY